MINHERNGEKSLIIHNICISEFHDFVGKQIICQYPEEFFYLSILI